MIEIGPNLKDLLECLAVCGMVGFMIWRASR